MGATSQILKETSGYRISHHTGEESAQVLLITFGAVSSGITTRGWGTQFALKQGYDNIYVAQREGSQYQDLPLEAFREAVAPVAADYDRVVTYGASLGGYAAVYYGGVIDAEIIAVSPHNSAHPLIHRRSFRKLPFAHSEIKDNPVSSKPPIVVHDPTLPNDNAFIDYLIRPAYPDLQTVEIPHGGHALLNTLKADGVLKEFIVPLLERREVVPVELRREKSRIWNAEYGRDLLQQDRWEEAEKHLRASVELKLNKHAARSLAKLYGRSGRRSEMQELNQWLEEQRLRQKVSRPAWLPMSEWWFKDRPATAFEAGTYMEGKRPMPFAPTGKRTVLARQPGYMFTLHRQEELSDTLLISFGRTTSGLKYHGGGRGLAQQLGADYLYVAQREGSNYQELSRESFYAVVEPLLEDYRNVLAVGSGLGGYAALYYGPAVNARVLAFSPYVQGHPEFSSKSDVPFQHKALQPGGESVTIAWNPNRTSQHRMVDRVLRSAFPEAEYLALRSETLSTYDHLHKTAGLQEFVRSRIA